MNNILAAIDFSDVSDAVVAMAANLARSTGAKLTVIHVAPPDPDFVGYDPGPQTVRDQVARHFKEEHQKLQRLAEDMEKQGIDGVALLIQGPTIEKIREEADNIGADVIVLGSHGHGALRKTLLGSVSEGILSKGIRPVLIVPAGKFEE